MTVKKVKRTKKQKETKAEFDRRVKKERGSKMLTRKQGAKRLGTIARASAVAKSKAKTPAARKKLASSAGRSVARVTGRTRKKR